MQFERQFFADNQDEIDIMPIVPLNEDEMSEDDKKKLPSELIVLPIRNMVLFPNVVLPITASREKSIQALLQAEKNGKYIGVISQRDSNNKNPKYNDINKIGTVAEIIKQIKMPDNSTTVFIRGRIRFEIEEWVSDEPFFKAKVKYLNDELPNSNDKEFIAMSDSVKEFAEQIIKKSTNIPPEASIMIRNINNINFLHHFIASNLNCDSKEKQLLLEENDFKKRTENLLRLLQIELQHVELKNKITSKTNGELDKQQKEYFLNQQLKAIQDELGGDGNDREIKDLQKRAEQKKFSESAKEMFQKGIEKLQRMHPSTPDYSTIYNHLDLLLDLPWDEYTEDIYDIKKARKVLDHDHYGMNKIKDRILEYLAVLKLKGDMKSPILCFIGPPGIGKTSLGKSIANAIGRKYIRLSLGGMHDESELRGHRKTYIGAMPGRIIQSLRKVKSSNPVFILDELDKLGRDYRGEPSSALLEVLDPEQNNSFYDNYLELDYDLSKVLFIATANSISEIQPALRDRLEIIDLSGYALEEKIEIAKKHLVPKQKEAHGLLKFSIKIPNTSIAKLIQEYTKESGVRELERQIASLMRNSAMKIALDENIQKIEITEEDVEEILGKPKYTNELYQKSNPPGVAIGLAWTSVGGVILFIESVLSHGKGNLTLTGNLGNVMKESATTALSYIQAHTKELKIDSQKLENSNIHIHVPEGATPKDGPSAGVTMLTTMVSALTGKIVKPFLAMTGEITLRGQVLPVGGIKEKVLAAKRAGMKEILLCDQNEKDVLEINPSYIKGLKFHYVSNMLDVLKIAIPK
ncbi:MAG TPA: endopeptidase La [Chitinophagaceae bacterium]|nr:MAG: ATP-dependent protease La [Bacteroidetes bacterium OLB11]HMN32861.1 endopeptidase La [Chitinophagaceae bacterium]